MTRRFLFTLVLGLLVAPWSGSANDTSVGVQAGQVMPIKSTSLRLLREDLRVIIGPQQASVEVSFRLRNEGEAAKVQLGFPYYSASESIYEDDNGRPDVLDFQCKVDGQAVACISKTGPNIDPRGSGAGYKSTSWKMWSVPFQAGQVRTISHRYRGDLGGSTAGRLDSQGVSFFDYILTTGRNWKGPIKEFHLTLATTGGPRPSDVYGASLPGFRQAGDQFLLDLTDFTPDQELFIAVGNDFQRHPLKAPANWVNPAFQLRTALELFPESARRALTEADLQGRSARDLTLMRNEIYARKGRPFQDRQLRDYFNKRQWYKPDPGYSDQRLSELELRNARLILDYQKRHGLLW